MEKMPTVLVVDDEQPIRALLTRWLAKWRYDVREAESAMAALDIMAADAADIIIADISMPEHDGLWLAEQVHAKWPTTPVIMGTGNDQVEVVRESRKLGAVAYVLKPFDPDLLRQAVDRAAGRLHFRPSVEER